MSPIDVQREVFKRVARVMLEQFGDRVEASVATASLSVAVGSASVDVEVRPWRDDALIVIRAELITGARLEHALYDFLLHENHTLDLGAFSINGAGSVVFGHNILGSTFETRDLRASLWSVMNVADQYDDRIQQHWGGLRAVDRNLSQEIHVDRRAGTIDETLQFSSHGARGGRRNTNS
ncbi:MAG: hypothetical protein KC502_01705 [Myxococcales bacterium]|nr:hypothetical protein [Myxococcales bacterium]